MLFNSGALPGRPTVCVTLGYLAGADGELVSEQEAWRKLCAQFKDASFDEGFKKARGTFAVVGNAFSQGGRAITGLEVRVRFASLEKGLHVHGDRYWELGASGWRPSAPVPFTSMPVGLAQAFGGDGWPSNPIGRGYYANADDANGMLLPNVELPGAGVRAPQDRPLPATFHPLPAGAPQRTRLIGKTDEYWRENEFPRLPADTDPGYFDGVDEAQCAPGYWRGDEEYSVTGMHLDKALVSGALPALRPRLLWRSRAEPAEVREAVLDLDTVWLLPNSEQVLLFYRALIEVAQIDAVDIAAMRVYTEKLREPATALGLLVAQWNAELEAKPARSARGPEQGGGVDADASSLRDEFWARFVAAREAILKESIAEAKKAGVPIDFPPPVRPPMSPQPRLQPVSAADMKAKVAAARVEANQLLRKTLQESGMDADAILAQTAKSPPATVAVSDLLKEMALAGSLNARMSVELAEAEQFVADLTARVNAARSAMPKPAALAWSPGASAADAPPPQALPRARRELDAAGLREALARKEPVVRIRIEDADLTDVDLSEVDLSGSEFVRCLLNGAPMTGATLADTVFTDCNLERVDAMRIDGRRMSLRNTSWQGAKLRQADLSASRADGCAFDNANFSGAKLEKAQLMRTSLVAAVLEDAHAASAVFSACNLTDIKANGVFLSSAVIKHCRAERASFAAACLRGSSWWNVAGRQIGFCNADMSGARIGSDSDFQSANFEGANLTNASARNTSFESATLRGACLERALFANCNLSDTDAYRVVATQADLAGSNFSGARWVSANLMQASLRRTTLVNVDLRGANLFAADVRGAVRRGLALQDAMLARSEIGEPA